MKKIKTILFAIVATVSLSSCTLDSGMFGVNAVGYPTHRAHTPAIYHTTRSYRYVDLRPDWMRYGGNWIPERSYHHRHH